MKIRSPLLQAIRFAEPVYAIALIAWFLGLTGLGKPDSFNAFTLATTLFGTPPDSPAAFISVTVLVWAVPVLALWKIASVFLADALPDFCEVTSPLAILANVLASLFVLIAQLLHALTFATGVEYFAVYSLGQWIMSVVTLAWNGVAIVAFIRSLSSRDAGWTEYQEFKKTNAEDKKGIFARISNWGIQRRLLVSFITIIFLVIAVLGFMLLRDFSSTILIAVQHNGLNLTEQTANVVSSNPTDKIAIDDFLQAQKAKNAKDDFSPFNSLSFWLLNPKSKKLEVSASTDGALVGTAVEFGEDAKLTASTFRSVGENQLEFLAPVIFGKKNIGYVKAIYDNNIILKPYYRTQFKVFMIAAIFLYLASFVTYLFGRNIVIPILFLRMSVKTISTMLAQMMHGSRRINTNDLMYQDRVTSRDEIKSLSMEIGNMATVIRGVIPYISASTLKNAERSSPSSEKRDLAFLFTDIRGFTTLCEGREPAEVVELLNHFLELQSSIILANHGDIDKFVGDEIMAMFEGPDKELNACRASLGIRLAMAREKELAEAAKKHVVAIGIGINTGPVTFGSVGAQDRMDFTSIGDTVNLAARLEGANKEYGTKTLITEAVYEKVKDEFLCREIDLMTVKGKNLPVRIYEVFKARDEAAPKLLTLATTFEKGLAAYRAQDWDGAEKVFLHLIKEFADDTCEIFLERVNMFRKNPPKKDWDGVFNLTVK